ncbi:hypothetical protein B2G71_03320 [Novosphingobium sp. PC22D]|uniref:LysM peptidoglycan-binding domain-containing M23 family metallopeptidase n=1 Tax=Novosphingobium sp. PC22D TaxID=1962403 RepID=UPI000BF1CFB4|nr:LysM peptidoglycan-binding domain-containing M23 family metallopeptidase [Novosphingobium sp. PC22D]PEQ14610.1 hypothetical protein B2G71_03320 [Novosphingobium sp. PC22D]
MRRLVFLAAAPLLILSEASAATPREESEHVVLEGETLNGIANRAGVPRERIIEANGLEPPYVVRIGETLAIPRGGGASRTIAARGPSNPDLSQASSYVVAPGDSLGGVALRAGVPRVLIAEANGLEPPYVIRIGQTLKIPRTGAHTVAAGETGFAIAMARGVPWSDIAVANGLDPDAPLRPGARLLIPTVVDAPMKGASSPLPPGTPETRFAWPLSGDVRRSFTERGTSAYHDGLDIRAARGTAVRAAAAGEVLFAGKEEKDFGNLVVIDHGNGWHTAYGFLSRITVKQGHKVARGERIGLVGSSGRARGDELHFEVRHDGAPVDPMPELPETP